MRLPVSYEILIKELDMQSPAQQPSWKRKTIKGTGNLIGFVSKNISATPSLDGTYGIILTKNKTFIEVPIIDITYEGLL